MTRRPSLRTLLALPAIWLIRAYQLVLSPMTPQSCRFYPSCSVYAITAIERFGLLQGLLARRPAAPALPPVEPRGRGPRSAGGTFASAAVEDPTGTLPLDLNRHRPPSRRPGPHLVSDHSPDP